MSRLRIFTEAEPRNWAAPVASPFVPFGLLGSFAPDSVTDPCRTAKRKPSGPP